MPQAATVDEVLTRMRGIDASLPAGDGVAVFNRMYLTVTERIAAGLASGGAGQATPFHDVPSVTDLDVRFADLFFRAYDADATHGPVPVAWRPLFQARTADCLPIQFALAGMNAHIEHDLPIAVVATCSARHLDLESIHADYLAVNDVLAEVESAVRRSFLDAAGRVVDDRVGALVHVVSSWDITAARDLAWVTAQTLWQLRRVGILRDRFLDGLAHTVGMTSRVLLTPTGARLPAAG